MKTKYTELPDANQLVAERTFQAPKDLIWKYYTTADLLDKWWAPKPYQAITHDFDFRSGGYWHYVMQGPVGEKHYCINNYQTISPEQLFTATDAFANPDWTVKSDLPTTNWEVTFNQQEHNTDLKVTLTCQAAQDLETLVNMGMKPGFDQALDQLETLLQS